MAVQEAKLSVAAVRRPLSIVVEHRLALLMVAIIRRSRRRRLSLLDAMMPVLHRKLPVLTMSVKRALGRNMHIIRVGRLGIGDIIVPAHGIDPRRVVQMLMMVLVLRLQCRV